MTAATNNFLSGNVWAGNFAGAAIVANRLVKLDTTEGQVIHTAAITDDAVGASLKTYASGDAGVEVQIGGIVKLTAAAAISLGAQVMPDSGGAGKIATAAGATAVSCGVALQAASADGDVISVLLLPALKAPANS